MLQKNDKPVLAVLALIAGLYAIAMGGCRSAPKEFSEQQLADAAFIREIAPDYWDSRGDRIEFRANQDPPPTLVLTEFAVEFVVEKLETPFKRQVIATPVSPITIGASAFGLGRRQVEIDDQVRRRVTERLFEVYLDKLAERGFNIVPPDRAQQTAAFARFGTELQGQSGVRQKLNFISTDTGRIKELAYEAPYNTKLITTTGPKTLELGHKEILIELGGTMAAQARFRVGVYRGFGAVEEGSQMLLYTRDKLERVEADRSLLTPREVVDTGSFAVGRGEVYVMDPEAFEREIVAAFERYLEMALLVAEAR